MALRSIALQGDYPNVTMPAINPASQAPSLSPSSRRDDRVRGNERRIASVHGSEPEVFDKPFWLLGVFLCAVAVACVPVFSAREGLSAISQYAALSAVIISGVSLLIRTPAIHPAVICYVGIVALWAFTYDQSEAEGYFTYVKLAVFAVGVHTLIRTRRHVLVLLAAYSLAASIGLLMNWGDIKEVRYAMETTQRAASSIRFEGTFANANRAGIFAGMAVVSTCIVFFNMRHNSRWLLLICGVSSGLIIGGLSGSRTGMLGILIAGLAVPLMAVAGQQGRVFAKVAKSTLLAAVAIAVAVTTLVQLPQFQRLSRLTEGVSADGSASTRWAMAQASIDVWKAHPIAGAGFRGFQKVSEYAGRPAHTAFGAVLADGGLIGFTLFCTWYFLPGFHLLNLARRSPDLDTRRLAVGLLVFLAAFSVGSMFSHLHGSRDLVPLWAGICGFVQHQRSRWRRPSKPLWRRQQTQHLDSNHLAVRRENPGRSVALPSTEGI